jgi:hypothetical protein
MTTAQVEIFAVFLLSAGAAIGGKIIWDWVMSGRVGDAYLKRSEFLQHKSDCCVLKLKSEFTEHRELDMGRHSDMESRMRTVEKRLDQGREDFAAIRTDISNINKSMARISAVLEFKWGREAAGIPPREES